MNRLTEFFAPDNWTVELIALIGNHDMLSLEGGGNSMEVFARVNPLIRVISVPTVWAGALLV